jgi:hydrogenase maturation protease
VSVPLVIGYGNTLRGDDGAGVVAAELIRERGLKVDVLTFHELQPEHAEVIAERAKVIFIDASITTGRLTVRPVVANNVAPSSTHHLAPEQLMRLARSLYGSCPKKAYMLEIPALRCDFGETMSEETLADIARCPAAVDVIISKG